MCSVGYSVFFWALCLSYYTQGLTRPGPIFKADSKRLQTFMSEVEQKSTYSVENSSMCDKQQTYVSETGFLPQTPISNHHAQLFDYHEVQLKQC